MRLRLIRLSGAILLVGALLGNADRALAALSTTGAGAVSASVGAIIGPSAVTVVQSGTSIAISWTAASVSSGAAVDGYYVKRSDGTTICGAPTLVSTLSCTDTSGATGSYTYAVAALYRSWDAPAASGSFTVLTAPTITSSPPNSSNSATASFGFSGGNGSSYACQLDAGTSAGCSSPTSYSGLAAGSHTFKVYAARGSSTGPGASYSWSID